MIAPTNIILMWIYGQDRYLDPPDAYLGPFTNAEAVEICKTLTCEHQIKVLSKPVPEWART